MIAGGSSTSIHGTWSEPVEGRGVSHEETKGERAVFAKAMSRTEGLVIVSNGKRVYTPGVLRRWDKTSKARSKYRVERGNSLSERERQGSASG